MAITYSAIYQLSDGTLVSWESSDATTLTDPALAAKGLARKPIAAPPDTTVVWDKVALTFKPIVVVLSADETLRQTLITQNVAVTPLTASQRDQANQLILKKLGAM